jgi:hypothetical protein
MPANAISGRVVHKESGIGIPDLLVVIYDLDPGTDPDDVSSYPEGGEAERGGESETARGELGDRIGSRLTDREGAFRFSFEDEEFRIRDANERRPDLRLVVMAPEQLGVGPEVIFTSAEIRQDAGRTEEYLIRMTSDDLRRARVPNPLDRKGADSGR